jgi:hypothetical protein
LLILLELAILRIAIQSADDPAWGAWAPIASNESDWRSKTLAKHDLFGKPVSIPERVRDRHFPNHALKAWHRAAWQYD